MRRSAPLLALILVLAACSPGGVADTATGDTTTTIAETTTSQSETTTTVDDGFPATVEDMNGPVTIEDRPVSIVSLSATATEMLFAIGF